jgi:hypothetical protein
MTARRNRLTQVWPNTEKLLVANGREGHLESESHDQTHEAALSWVENNAKKLFKRLFWNQAQRSDVKKRIKTADISPVIVKNERYCQVLDGRKRPAGTMDMVITGSVPFVFVETPASIVAEIFADLMGDEVGGLGSETCQGEAMPLWEALEHHPDGILWEQGISHASLKLYVDVITSPVPAGKVIRKINRLRAGASLSTAAFLVISPHDLHAKAFAEQGILHYRAPAAAVGRAAA